MAWNDIILSTTDSIKRHLSKINTYALSGSDWTGAISIAKERVGNDIIARMGHKLDGLDDIENASTLGLTSDYQTLMLIYTQLSHTGLYEIYDTKKIWYWNMYNALLSQAISRLKINNIQPFIPSGHFQL